MGVTLLVLAIAAIVTVATVKEYLKQKEHDEAQKNAETLEAFKEEERLFEAQVTEELAKITPEPVVLETYTSDPAPDIVASPKPKKKYYHKKKSAGKPTNQKKASK